MYFLFFSSPDRHYSMYLYKHKRTQPGRLGKFSNLFLTSSLLLQPTKKKKKKGCWGSPADHLTRYGEADPTSTPHTPALESALSHCGILGTPGAQ